MNHYRGLPDKAYYDRTKDHCLKEVFAKSAAAPEIITVLAIANSYPKLAVLYSLSH